MGLLSGSQRLGAAALLLAASSLLSRLMGLIRDKIISWQFGASHEADMYFAAFVVPDIINYLLAGGFMSITMIPLLARAFQKDGNDAWRLFSAIFGWITAASCLLTLAGEIWALPLASLVAPGFDDGQLRRLAFFMRLILPGQIFFLSGASFTALLFLRRQFAVPALSPLVYNGCIIIFGLLLPLTAANPAAFGMTGYCIGVGIGAFLGAFLLPLAVALKGGLAMRFNFCHRGIKKFLIIALPLMLGQTVVMLDEQFLRVFGSLLPEGNVSLLNYGRRIAQVPVSLMGQAIAVASYPFLVKLLAENRSDEFSATLNRALAAGLAIVIPLSLWMMAAARPLLGLIFEGGRFSAADAAACAPLAQIMLAPALAWIIYMVIARAFYAHEDTITPALTGTAVTVLCIPCYYWLAIPNGSTGIAAVSTLSICAYVAWLCLIWLKRHGPEAFSGLLNLCARVFAASLAPAACAWLICVYLPSPVAAPLAGHCLRLGISLAAFTLLTLPLAWLFCPELLGAFWKMLNRKRFRTIA